MLELTGRKELEKLTDTADLKSAGRKAVRVQFPPPAPHCNLGSQDGTILACFGDRTGPMRPEPGQQVNRLHTNVCKHSSCFSFIIVIVRHRAGTCEWRLEEGIEP